MILQKKKEHACEKGEFSIVINLLFRFQKLHNAFEIHIERNILDETSSIVSYKNTNRK